MQEQKKVKVLELVKEAHAEVEKAYLQNPATKGSTDWLQKRRLLLADLGLHLVQASVSEDEVNRQKLKRYLFSILTISEEFIPGYGLSETAEKLAIIDSVPEK